jgi:dTDP-4-dehydrorhamnose reductase
MPFVISSSKQIDITQLDAVSDFIRVNKITHVINCAAYTQVDQAEKEQKEAYLINAVGAHHVGMAARRHGARLIHFSTDYIFDGQQQLPYVETHSPAPLNAYGLSKWAGEMKLLDELEQLCIIRTSWLFGYPGKNFVGTVLNLLQTKETLRVVADQKGRPTYCQDLAAASLDLLDATGIFHFANSHETSWYLFAREIHKQTKELGYAIKTERIDPISTPEYPLPARRPAYSTLDTRKFEESLKKTIRPWQEALHDHLVHLKQYQETGKP